MGTPSTGTTGTTGTTQQQTGLQGILNLPQTAFNQVRDLLGTFGISLAEGGTVGYAKGGAVKPVPANFQNYLKNKAKRKA
jgi:hypothetical protein